MMFYAISVDNHCGVYMHSPFFNLSYVHCLHNMINGLSNLKLIIYSLEDFVILWCFTSYTRNIEIRRFISS